MKVINYVLWVTVLKMWFISAWALNRSSFPDGFLFGTTSAAVQYEGAAFEDGKGPSIWDHFAHQFPDKMFNRSNPDVADDFYHLYKEDVKLMEYFGFNAFRFSISWARILPRGKLSRGVNKEGVAFYNNLINELRSKGIQPLVTLYHWDMPQELDDEYGGFLSPNCLDDYLDYVELCFKEFGDRVKHWMTFNEPYVIARYGYDLGTFAPGRCSPWVSPPCPAGDSATEPYIAAHHLLLAHAAAVKLYRENYKETQKGEIGLNLVCHWFVPYSNTKEDLSARQRALDFMVGWTLHPLTYGDYPYSMRRYVKHRLPKFSSEQKETLKGSYDFIGLSYYTGKYAAYDPTLQNNNSIASSTDSFARISLDRNGQYIGPQTGSPIYCIYSKGLEKVLSYISEKYNKPSIYITENGIADVSTNTTLKESINDPHRTSFYHSHLLALQQAIKKGVNVKGFLAWSFLDNFEWASAFNLRYGLVYVDYKDGLKRYPKGSAFWFKKFLHVD